jgi:CheY-like chemotaxis protein
MNLVSNSADAMPDGGDIYITTENRYVETSMSDAYGVSPGDYVVLMVSDTGVGISPEDIEKIFEPFYTKKVMGRSGTGLGMAVVWGAVKDHRGHIDVRSVPGRGSTFTLYFPATHEPMPKIREKVAAASYEGNGESILVVDDVAMQRTIASTLLEAAGYIVNTVSSGEAAIEYLTQHRVDLIVLDMIMAPGIDGLDTYKRIIELRPGQRAIIASGFSESERVKAAQALGAGAYIKKPYTLEKIALAVKEELQRK